MKIKRHEYISKNLNLNKISIKNDFDFVVIATPTNYDPDTNNFDTSTVEHIEILIHKILPQLLFEQLQYFIERSKKILLSRNYIYPRIFTREALYDSLTIENCCVLTTKKFAQLLLREQKKVSTLYQAHRSGVL